MRDTGQGGVHPGLEQREPDDDAQRRRTPTSVPHRAASGATTITASQPIAIASQPSVEVVGVEDGDHDDRADVVDDRQREQEQPGRRRDPPTQQRRARRRRRRCRSPSGCPSRRRRRRRRDDRDVERGRDHHAADGGHDRQRGGLGVAQVAVDQLVLDLEPDDEEEDHHQGVVDPVLQRLLEVQRADVEARCGCARTRRTTTPTDRSPRSARRRRRASSSSEPAASTRRNSRIGRATSRASGLLLAQVGRAGLPDVVAAAGGREGRGIERHAVAAFRDRSKEHHRGRLATGRPDFPAHLWSRVLDAARLVGSQQSARGVHRRTAHMAIEPIKDTDPTIGKLVMDAQRDISTLISKEIQLAKSELKVSVKHGGIGIGLFAGAGLPRSCSRSSCCRSRSPTSSTGRRGLDLHWSFLDRLRRLRPDRRPARLHRPQAGQAGQGPRARDRAGQADPAALKGRADARRPGRRSRSCGTAPAREQAWYRSPQALSARRSRCRPASSAVTPSAADSATWSAVSA